MKKNKKTGILPFAAALAAMGTLATVLFGEKAIVPNLTETATRAHSEGREQYKAENELTQKYLEYVKEASLAMTNYWRARDEHLQDPHDYQKTMKYLSADQAVVTPILGANETQAILSDLSHQPPKFYSPPFVAVPVLNSHGQVVSNENEVALYMYFTVVHDPLYDEIANNIMELYRSHVERFPRDTSWQKVPQLVDQMTNMIADRALVTLYDETKRGSNGEHTCVFSNSVPAHFGDNLFVLKSPQSASKN